MPIHMARAAQAAAKPRSAASQFTAAVSVEHAKPAPAEPLENSVEAEFEEMEHEMHAQQTTDATFDPAASRVDADHFRGLRDEMKSDGLHGNEMMDVAVKWGQNIVTVAIALNGIQMGMAVQYKGQMEELWIVAEHIFTSIFVVEMVLKLYAWHLEYFFSPWNCLDFMVVNISVLSVWILPLAKIEVGLGSLKSLRLLRLMRLLRLLRISKNLRMLVENFLCSLQSLGSVLLLLVIVSYIFAIICCQTIEMSYFADDEEFDPEFYFGDIPGGMLTLFNICILAEWPEIIRPMYAKQPAMVFFVFIPFLMLCTFGVLNLVIGVIAEQTLANAAAAKQAEESDVLRGKMKAIIRMTDELYENHEKDALTKEEFVKCAMSHPDFVSTMRECNFPRGFDIRHLHMIFDDSAEGTVDKDEFINGMFRIVFNDLSQHAATLLLSVAQVKVEIHQKVEQEIEKMAAMLAQRLPDFHATSALPSGCEGTGSSSTSKLSTCQEEVKKLAPKQMLEPVKDLTHDSLKLELQHFKTYLDDQMKAMKTSLERMESPRQAHRAPPSSDCDNSTTHSRGLGEVLESQQQWHWEVMAGLEDVKRNLHRVPFPKAQQISKLASADASPPPVNSWQPNMDVDDQTTMSRSGRFWSPDPASRVKPTPRVNV